MGTEYCLGKMKTFWRWLVVMAVQQCEVLDATELNTKMIKVVTFILCIFYHKFYKENKL